MSLLRRTVSVVLFYALGNAPLVVGAQTRAADPPMDEGLYRLTHANHEPAPRCFDATFTIQSP